MKVIKFVGKLVLCLVVLVVALVLALPLWIGPVARTAANSIVPPKTKTGFNLGGFALNPYTGTLSVADVLLNNPEGFDPPVAVQVGKLDVKLDVCSLAGDTIVINDIDLSNVFVSYVTNRKMESNFTVIQKNVKGDDAVQKAPGGEKSTAVHQPAVDRKDGATQSVPADRKSDKPEKKVIIDHLKISGVTVQFALVKVPLPTIELKDIGRKSNGVTIREAWDQVYAQVMQAAQALNVNIGNLTKNIDAKKLNNVINAVKKIDSKSLNKVFDAVGAIGQSAGKAVGTAGQSAGKAVGNGTEKTTEALGEQTEKAVNALKGLFQ